MIFKFHFLFCIFLYVGFYLVEVHSQTLPSIAQVSNQGLSGSQVKLENGLSLNALSSKPKLPYLEELRQIQSLKHFYDSLKSELKEIKEYAQDSTQRDSLLMVAKERKFFKRNPKCWKA